jgi:CheY-like chemotaxis protein
MTPSPIVPNRPGRVMVVDDSAVIRRLLVAHLRQAGHDVGEAQDGAQALQAFRGEAREVVIADVSMPGLGGLDLLAALRHEESPPEVILLTGVCDAAAEVQALRLGAHDYISKAPSALDAVVLAVARALGKRRLREENERLVRELHAFGFTDPLIGLGTTLVPEDDDQGGALSARADAAPYEAGRQGRNQVRKSGDGEPIALPPVDGAPAPVLARVAEGRA